MRIAQIAPLFESVPPKGYGGTERVVHYLTEELVRRGHEVVLYASGDSKTRGELVACAPQALRLDRSFTAQGARSALQLERVARDADRFDVLHFHTEYMHLPLVRRLAPPHLTTLHWRLDQPDLAGLHAEFPESPVVSISDAQRRPLPGLNWLGTVHHGLPTRLLRFCPGPGGCLAFLGRMSPEKRPDRAIRIAQKAGWPLMIAAKVDPLEADYFDRRVRPLLSSRDVTFVGEIGEAEKNSFLGSAAALLFPIDWPEPFGLAIIEAMACGTPVIAFRHGSAPELIDDGVTGYLVDTEEQAISAVKQLHRLDRRAVRAAFESRFSASRMAQRYLSLYHQLARIPASA